MLLTALILALLPLTVGLAITGCAMIYHALKDLRDFFKPGSLSRSQEPNNRLDLS